jgi:hypothetical protein
MRQWLIEEEIHVSRGADFRSLVDHARLIRGSDFSVLSFHAHADGKLEIGEIDGSSLIGEIVVRPD